MRQLIMTKMVHNNRVKICRGRTALLECSLFGQILVVVLGVTSVVFRPAEVAAAEVAAGSGSREDDVRLHQSEEGKALYRFRLRSDKVRSLTERYVAEGAKDGGKALVTARKKIQRTLAKIIYINLSEANPPPEASSDICREGSELLTHLLLLESRHILGTDIESKDKQAVAALLKHRRGKDFFKDEQALSWETKALSQMALPDPEDWLSREEFAGRIADYTLELERTTRAAYDASDLLDVRKVIESYLYQMVLYYAEYALDPESDKGRDRLSRAVEIADLITNTSQTVHAVLHSDQMSDEDRQEFADSIKEG